MDAAQRELFGSFPRRVGTPSQHWVFTEAQVDLFLETISGKRNAYVTVNRLPIDGSGRGLTGLEADKVFFDFDGDKSALDDGMAADVAVARMRDDPDLADAVLGDAVAEARQLAERSLHDGVPVLGVFSGFGVHVHQLYQPTDEGVQTKQASTARRYIDLLDLETADEAVIDNGQRICRMPNVERTTYEEKESRHGVVKVADGRGTGLWTVPIGGEELTEMTVEWLLEESRGPTYYDESAFPDDRPEMGVFADYVDDLAHGDDGWSEAKPVEERSDGPEGDVRVLLEELIRMPCMVERLDQPNPCQTVRVNGAVMLFNLGMNPQEVNALFRRLNWTDYDRKTTMKHLRHIYNNGYSDQSCWTLRRKGMCVVDDPSDCPTHGWSGGKPEWKQ